jgi:hypothetical protein
MKRDMLEEVRLSIQEGLLVFIQKSQALYYLKRAIRLTERQRLL